jgi:hypothetical protein
MQLGFDIDWSGIATGLVKGVADYSAQRGQIKVQMAQLQAQTAAQQRAAQPPPAYPPTTAQALQPNIAPAAGGQPRYYTPQSSLPSWALPVGAAAGVGVLLLLLVRPR